MIALLLQGLGLCLLAFHLGAIGLYLRRLRRALPRPGVIGTPRVTLLRPVCGLDAFDEETLRSSFLQDYPDYEVIFCAQSPDDPAVPLVRRLIAEHPGVEARLLIGYDRVTRNPKLNNVLKGWNAAESDWVCMTDSNLLLPDSYLATVVDSWGPATGLVSAPPVGLRPEGFFGHLECAFLNTNQAILQYAADSIGPAFAQGKTLFFNRPLLSHAGGLTGLGQTLAEDVAATKVVRAFGRSVNLTPLPFAQPIGRRSLSQVWLRQLRWSRVRRDGFPLLFAVEILNGGLLPALMFGLGLGLAGGDGIWALGFVATWYLAEVLVARAAGWPMSVKDLAALLVRDLMIPAIWGATFLRRGFEWRGTDMGETPKREALAGSIVPAE